MNLTLIRNQGLFFLFVVSNLAYSQIKFVNSSSKLSNKTFYTYLSKGVADMNNDGRDDIIRSRPVIAASPSSFFIEYQQANGSFISDSIGKASAIPQLSMAIGDINRDGKNDIITGGGYDGIHVFKNNGSNFSLTHLTTPPKILIQASNLVDINNDGWLDYFACHDEGLNQVYSNDKAGNLSPNSTWIDLTTHPTSDNSGNYGSVWSDIDNDGDLDLYIAKCSMYAMNKPDDLRRINMLYINNGNGTYTERAADYGLKISGQSWTADFADIDNDGDMDCFITNHELPSMLLENDGFGHFTDITPATGIGSLGHPLQGLMIDFDNDGFVDVLSSGNESHLYRNNGNKTFSEIINAFSSDTLKSFAIGDLNHDGFLDVYASYWFGERNNIKPDVLWLNQKNSNHFFVVTLSGTASNSSAIGARLTLYYANGKKQIREVRSGESYGISNTLTQHFGLGQSTQIDRLEISWPSGKKQTIDKPTADQFLSITEPQDCMQQLCIPITAKLIKI